MKVISLVPSWTETLVESGIEVVGRTRYCIHPDSLVNSIQIVGGTKDIQWNKIADLQADILIVDKEENRAEIKEKSPIPFVASHVESVQHMPGEIDKFIETLKLDRNHPLSHLKQRWQKVIEEPKQFTIEDLPGVIQWIKRPQEKISKIHYIIWKKPWMEVSKNTFIGSVLSHLGYEDLLNNNFEKYPKFSIENYLNKNTLLLFSSEPYSFGDIDELNQIKELGVPAALVDGEKFSWFGLRTLKFLESL